MISDASKYKKKKKKNTSRFFLLNLPPESLLFFVSTSEAPSARNGMQDSETWMLLIA